jgi:hypothetical protein
VEAASLPAESSPPWRRAALLAGGIAVAELAAIVVLGLALLAGPLARTVRSHVTAQARAHPTAHVAPRQQAKHARPVVHPPAKPRLSRRHTHVLVLNGNGRQGAAAAAASRLRSRGYPPATTGNASRTDYAASLVMYRPGYLPEARRLARDARVKLVGPLDGLRPAQLKGAQVVLLLG